MHKLIADLLDLTQIESGKKNRQLAAVDLRAAAQAAVDTVQAEADRAKHRRSHSRRRRPSP